MRVALEVRPRGTVRAPFSYCINAGENEARVQQVICDNGVTIT